MNPIFPSILSTDFFNLESKLQKFSDSGIDHIHLDVMDGHFVTNLSFGPALINPLKKMNFIVDSHLMVSNPSRMIPKFIEQGSDWISFHIETEDRIDQNLELIRNSGIKAGLAINPDTKPEKLFPYLEKLDYILLMSVFPGYGGQKFIPESIERAKRISTEIKHSGKNIKLQIDGGLNSSIIADLEESGVEIFVVGTYLYNSDRINDKISELMKIINGEHR